MTLTKSKKVVQETSKAILKMGWCILVTALILSVAFTWQTYTTNILNQLTGG